MKNKFSECFLNEILLLLTMTYIKIHFIPHSKLGHKLFSFEENHYNFTLLRMLLCRESNNVFICGFRHNQMRMEINLHMSSFFTSKFWEDAWAIHHLCVKTKRKTTCRGCQSKNHSMDTLWRIYFWPNYDIKGGNDTSNIAFFRG